MKDIKKGIDKNNQNINNQNLFDIDNDFMNTINQKLNNSDNFNNKINNDNNMTGKNINNYIYYEQKNYNKKEDKEILMMDELNGFKIKLNKELVNIIESEERKEELRARLSGFRQDRKNKE